MSAYNNFDLLAKVGALNLDPRNASRPISLDALAHLLAAQPYRPNTQSISRYRLEMLLGSHLGVDTEPGKADDPAPQMFTEEIIFPGGPYIVFPGPVTDDHEMLRWLLRAALKGDPPVGLKPFRDEVTRAAIMCLSASDRIARKAGIKRGVAPQLDERREIFIPDASVIQKCADAVTFSKSDIVSFNQGGRFLERTVEPLTVDIGAVDWDNYSFDFGDLHYKPFVQAGDSYVVPVPSFLLSSLLHRVLRIALEHDVLTALADAFRSVVWSEIKEVLGYSGSHPSPIELPSACPSEFIEGLFSLDSDKVIYVQLATDLWGNFTGQKEPPKWDMTQLGQDLDKRNEEVVRHLSLSKISADRVLTLTVLQSTGRWFVIGLDGPQCKNLHLGMQASNLRAITLSESTDPLGLWKFARANDRLRSRTEIFSCDLLDQYAIYKSLDHGYYLSDDQIPDCVSIQPGAGLDIRQDNSERLDPHGVPAFVTGCLMEVWSFFGNRVPISSPPALIGRQPTLVVEGELPIPVWVVGQTDIDNRLKSLQRDLVGMVAFWIWQFESLIGPCLAGLAENQDMFTIHLEIDNPQQWREIIETSRFENVGGSPLISRIENDETGIKIALHPSLLAYLNRPDNQGERELVRQLLSGLKGALRTDYPETKEMLAATRVDDAIEQLAPLGLKKKMVLFPDAPILRQDSGRPPHFRSVQEADREELLDYIGEHVGAKFGKQGPLKTAEDCNAAINEAVACLFRELGNLVETFDPTDLLSSLVAYNEVNVGETAVLDMTMPSRLACFGDRDELVEELVEETHTRDMASLANRFLVEYVAARSPSGTRHLSLEAYDRLLALASQISNLGILSDLVHFGLADTEVEILPSGRLGFNRSTYGSASRSFMSKHMSGILTQSERNFSAYWDSVSGEEGERSEPPPEVKLLDEAFASEFGLTLTELTQLLSDVYNLGIEQESPVKQLPGDKMTEALSISLEWNEGKVVQGLRLLTLGPRDDFLKPPGECAQEVYPWRFNRAWSYLRRPLLTTGCEPNSQILWGNRHLILATRYITDLCLDGRIKAKTVRLQRAVGSRRQREAEAFEELVGQLITERTKIPAKLRIRKVGKHKMVKSGKDLGDVDVLGVIPSKRVILCIECKDLVLARTPAEVQHQMEELITGSTGKSSTVRKHQERVKWVQAHLDEVLRQCFDIERKGNWRVKPILVSDSELYAAYLNKIPFPAWSLETLIEMTAEEIASNA